MKKLVCALLIMLMAAGTAFAGTQLPIEETSPFFDISIDLPEGYTLEQEVVEDVTIGAIRSDEMTEHGFTYFFTIAFSDLYTGRSLNDLSTEEVEELFRGAAAIDDTDGGDTASYAMADMADGLRAMVIYDSNVTYMCWALTVIDGYFVQLYGTHDDFSPVTQEEIERGVELLGLMRIQPVKQ